MALLDFYIKKIANKLYLTNIRLVSIPISTNRLLPNPEEALN